MTITPETEETILRVAEALAPLYKYLSWGWGNRGPPDSGRIAARFRSLLTDLTASHTKLLQEKHEQHRHSVEGGGLEVSCEKDQWGECVTLAFAWALKDLSWESVYGIDEGK